MNYEILIKHIKYFREQAQLTQLYLAHRLGSNDEDYYGKIERCQKELKLHYFRKIAHELSLSPIILLHLSDYSCFTPPPPLRRFKFEAHRAVSYPFIYLEFFESFQQPNMAKYDMHKVHFYESIYIGIKSARSMYKINTKELSLRMGYSVNHFARMERDNCEIILSQAFKICSALNISFVKLILLSNCLDFFTDSKGVFISLSELKKRYPEFNLQLLHA